MQRMVSGGRELIAGVTRDPVFGPLVMFGLGGIFVEALRDVAFRVAPIGDLDAQDMTGELRGAAILAGHARTGGGGPGGAGRRAAAAVAARDRPAATWRSWTSIRCSGSATGAWGWTGGCACDRVRQSTVNSQQ